MDFRVHEDIEVILELLGMTIQEFAQELGVSTSTVSRWKEPGETASPANLEKIYEYAFKKKIRLNKIKEQLFREECLENHVLLFHGAKTDISGDISIEKSLWRKSGTVCDVRFQLSALELVYAGFRQIRYDRAETGCRIGLDADDRILPWQIDRLCRASDDSEHSESAERNRLCGSTDCGQPDVPDHRQFY